VGWCRGAGGRWVRLASGPTLDACHKRLLAEARRRGLDRAARVLTTGRDPSAIPAGPQPATRDGVTK
jgi:hypothetical protein